MFSQWMRTVRTTLSLRSPHTVPLVVVAVAVLAANLPALIHIVTDNPLVLDAGLTFPTHGWLPGVPYIDPNAGFTAQALGHLAVFDWLHGHVPWWNPYEGMGAPLAGEMQSGAFFPPTLLLAFHQGILLLQLLLELVTGWSTYFLVRRLGVGRTFATAAGVAFGLCGTYAWLAHAPIRPVALLPLSLIGVERAIDAGRARRPGGWALLAVALALSILAGFPETTLIDGLLVGLWAVLRLIGPGRVAWRSILGKLATGGVVGLALAAPLIVAFASYLPSADLGGHTGGFAYNSIPRVGLVQMVLPYGLGPVFGFHATGSSRGVISLVWGNVGGYLSATLIAAGLVGLVGRRHRLLRLGLGGWIALCLLRTYGSPPVLHAMAAVPGLKSIAFFRYDNPSWVLAVVVLAALGLDDVARALTRRRALVAAAVATALVAGWAAVAAWSVLTGTVTNPPSGSAHPHAYPVVSLIMACTALAVLAVGGVLAGRATPSGRPGHPHARSRPSTAGTTDRTRRWGRVLMAGIVATESVLLLGFTYLSAPRPTALQLGSVTWLQHHLGTQRFYTLGPIEPDYGSYFGIAQANVNDLPLPRSWNDYIAADLDPNALRGAFTGATRIDPAKATPAEELSAHLAAFEAVGVRYVVERATGVDVQGQPFPAAGSPAWPSGPRLVHRDAFAEIWELPTAAPLFSATAPGSPGPEAACAVTGSGRDEVAVDCPHPSTLVRRVQFEAGWSATVDGSAVPVERDRAGPGGLFQTVAVPAGRSTVRFTYLPVHAGAAVAVALLALVFLVAAPVVSRRRARRRAGGPPPPGAGHRPPVPGVDSGHV